MNAKKLLHFADWLDRTIPDEKFDFTRTVTQTITGTDCGSICCAIGWLPLYDSRVKWHNCTGVMLYGDMTFTDYNKVARHIFGIPNIDAYRLFTPDEQCYIEGWGDFHWCTCDCTVKELTDAIRHYVKIKS